MTKDNVVPIDKKAEPTTALAAPAVSGPPSPNEWNAIAQVANAIHDTDFVPRSLRGKPGAVLACILTGRELGIGPMQALQQIGMIDGKPNLSAELQRALVQRAGHEIAVDPSSNDRMARVTGRRRDTGQRDEVAWTVEDAERAGLCKVGPDGKVTARSENGAPMPWEKYTRQLLVARATSELTGRLFADVLAGVSYTPDELTDGHEVAVEDIVPHASGTGAVATGTASGTVSLNTGEAGTQNEPPDPLKTLWTLFRNRWPEDAEAKLRSAIAPKASTKELDEAEVATLIENVQRSDWEPIVQTVWARLQAAKDAPWEPSAKDAEQSDNPVEARAFLLGVAANLAEELSLTDEGLAEVAGYKSPLPDLSLKSLRTAVERLEVAALEASSDGEPTA